MNSEVSNKSLFKINDLINVDLIPRIKVLEKQLPITVEYIKQSKQDQLSTQSLFQKKDQQLTKLFAICEANPEQPPVSVLFKANCHLQISIENLKSEVISMMQKASEATRQELLLVQEKINEEPAKSKGREDSKKGKQLPKPTKSKTLKLKSSPEIKIDKQKKPESSLRGESVLKAKVKEDVPFQSRPSETKPATPEQKKKKTVRIEQNDSDQPIPQDFNPEPQQQIIVPLVQTDVRQTDCEDIVVSDGLAGSIKQLVLQERNESRLPIEEVSDVHEVSATLRDSTTNLVSQPQQVKQPEAIPEMFQQFAWLRQGKHAVAGSTSLPVASPQQEKHAEGESTVEVTQLQQEIQLQASQTIQPVIDQPTIQASLPKATPSNEPQTTEPAQPPLNDTSSDSKSVINETPIPILLPNALNISVLKIATNDVIQLSDGASIKSSKIPDLRSDSDSEPTSIKKEKSPKVSFKSVHQSEDQAKTPVDRSEEDDSDQSKREQAQSPLFSELQSPMQQTDESPETSEQQSDSEEEESKSSSSEEPAANNQDISELQNTINELKQKFKKLKMKTEGLQTKQMQHYFDFMNFTKTQQKTMNGLDKIDFKLLESIITNRVIKDIIKMTSLPKIQTLDSQKNVSGKKWETSVSNEPKPLKIKKPTFAHVPSVQTMKPLVNVDSQKLVPTQDLLEIQSNLDLLGLQKPLEVQMESMDFRQRKAKSGLRHSPRDNIMMQDGHFSLKQPRIV